MDTKISIEQIRSLKYFWQQRGDLARSIEWERLQPAFERQYPHLTKAWRDYKAALMILDLVVDSLPEYDDDEKPI